jgi:hypothetical protein
MQISHRVRLLAASCIPLAACTSTPLSEEGGLARAWQQKLSEYNLSTIFPPREDFSVGDVYLLCDPPSPSKTTAGAAKPDASAPARSPLPLLVASVNAGALLQNHYATRVTPPTVATPRALQDGVVPALPRMPDNRPGPFGKVAGDAGRFRNVSLPEFFTVSARGGNLGALAPTPSALIGAGVTTSRFESISISVPWGSSYGLPLLDLMGLVQERFAAGTADRAAAQRLVTAAKGATDGGCATPRLVLVTEVYFAHSIDIRFEYSQEAAAQVRAAVMVDPNSTRKAALDALGPSFEKPDAPSSQANLPTTHGGTKPGSAPASDPSPGTAPATPGPSGPPTNRAAFDDAVKPRIDAGAAIPSTVPGVNAFGFSADASGITAKRYFTNPVAIGYRGVELTFDGTSIAFDPAPRNFAPATAVPEPVKR